MSNYRRLISYIYAYEGGIKGKNVGFAKLEVRNGQCKIQVNVRNVYIGSQDTGVYLLSGTDEILIGRIFIRNGAGEFRSIVSVNNVNGSGQTIDQCYGLTVHNLADSWQSYTTIWEDAVANTAQAALEEATSEQIEKREMEELPNSQITAANLEHAVENHKNSLTEAVEAEIEAQDQQAAELETMEIRPMEVTPISSDNIKASAKPQTEAPQGTAETEKAESEHSEPESSKEDTGNKPVPDVPQVPEVPPAAAEGEEEQEQPHSQPTLQPQVDPQPRQPEHIEEEPKIDTIWQQFFKRYPKIQAFDYNGGCEILTIKPQDIGLLPRETWGYGNNSFLLHGYYNHRYLIFARLNNPRGEPRYLLGVPGHYYSNEKYMASMFGFPNFVLSKIQPAGDGRFGYWYTDVRLSS